MGFWRRKPPDGEGSGSNEPTKTAVPLPRPEQATDVEAFIKANAGDLMDLYEQEEMAAKGYGGEVRLDLFKRADLTKALRNPVVQRRVEQLIKERNAERRKLNVREVTGKSLDQALAYTLSAAAQDEEFKASAIKQLEQFLLQLKGLK